ncbi:hypothetical protein [Marivita lacus]|nr:hypothetical protein [Marivita lacus]
MSDEAHIWLVYMLAPLGLAFLAIFVWNLCAAPYRIQKERADALEASGPKLPEIVYSTEWADGIAIMSIQDAACALAGIEPDGYAASARAKALASELIEAVYDGWVCSQEAHIHLISRIGEYEVRRVGKPQFPGIEGATIETQIYTPSLREDYLPKRPKLIADWIPEQIEGNPMIVTIEAH